jgi:hypothetical protein
MEWYKTAAFIYHLKCVMADAMPLAVRLVEQAAAGVIPAAAGMNRVNAIRWLLILAAMITN